MNSSFKSTRHFGYLLAALALTMVGCSPVYYRPTKAFAPGLTEKEQVSFALSAPDNFQAAISPVNHVGIIGGYSSFSQSGGVEENANLFEIGGGYYYSLPVKNGKWHQKVVFDLYGTMGRGAINVEYPYSWSMKISKYVIQPGFGYRSKYFEANLNWRFADVIYDYSGVPFSSTHVEYPKARTNYFFLEPAVTLRAGYKAIKVELQWVHMVNGSDLPWNADADGLSIGVYVICGGFRKPNTSVSQRK